MSSTTKSKSRKILVPLTTLLVAGAVAIGSGATFTTSTNNSISGVTSGSLEQSNSNADKALFDVSNIKPGDTVTGSVVITNSGSLAQKLTLTEGKLSDSFTKGDLQLAVTDVTDDKIETVYAGNFTGLGTQQLLAASGTSEWKAGEAHTYQFVVTLVQDAGNENQGQHAEADFTWDGVQTAGSAL